VAGLTAFATLRAEIGQFKSKMSEAAGEVQRLEKRGSGSFSKLAAVGKSALLGIGGVAIGVAGASLKLADDLEKSQAQMQNALRNSGDSFARLKPYIDDTNKRMTAFGFTNAQTEGAIAMLTTATGSGEKALNDMGLAANIARARHIELGDAASIVAKAAAGNVRVLKQFGIAGTDALSKIHDPAKRGAAIMALLGGSFKGAALAAAGTFGGKMEALHATVSNLGANLGQRLIPVIEKLATVTLKIVTWFEKHKAAAIALGIIVGGLLLAAIGAFTVSLFTAGGALAFLMGPIGLIVIAIAGLALLVYRYRAGFVTAFHDVLNVAKSVWHGIQDTIAAFWSVVRPIFDTILKIYIGAFKLEFRIVKDIITAAVHAIADVVKFLGRVFSDVFHGIGSVVHSIVGSVVGVVKGFINIIISGINILIRALDAIQIHIPSIGIGPIHTPSFDWNGLNIPEIPHFARGGIVPGTGPLLAVVHGGERITPANRVGDASGRLVVENHINLYMNGREVTRELMPSIQSELIRLKNRSGVTGVA
jgi:hypothetical protein